MPVDPPDDSLRVVLGLLAGLYVFLALAAVVQLVRIYWRVPELRWTTQKVFLLLTIIMATLRTLFFVLAQFVGTVFDLDDTTPLFIILADLPGVLFFSTYLILVLFWAKIISQASNQTITYTRTLRSVFLTVNVIVYLMQLAIWVLFATVGYGSEENKAMLQTVDLVFYGVIIAFAAVSFMFFGGRLFWLLRQSPQKSPGRSRKLMEVGGVTVLATVFLSVRSAVTLTSAFIDTMELSWQLVFCYYFFTELLPTWLIMFILRALPPKRSNRMATASLLQSENKATRWNFRSQISSSYPNEDGDDDEDDEDNSYLARNRSVPAGINSSAPVPVATTASYSSHPVTIPASNTYSSSGYQPGIAAAASSASLNQAYSWQSPKSISHLSTYGAINVQSPLTIKTDHF